MILFFISIIDTHLHSKNKSLW